MSTEQTEHTVTESFRDRIATVDKKGKRKWIFAQKPVGKFYNFRTWVSYGFFILFFALPFFHYNGRPLFLFNVPEAKFILFGQVFWPQDFFIFGIFMITFIIFIVLFTAAFGRLFCGWVCPQTIFMEMFFRKLEYLIEGDAAQQKMLAAAPWNGNKIARKLTKHLVFFLMAFIIANFFLAYVIGIKELWKIISGPVSMHTGGLMALLGFSAVFYGVYAYFREQACTVVCPYGRLQGVLLDRNSMVVAYNYKRGEPRGKIHKNEARSFGDCIDCFQCVKVCPTGIDIRNGTQLECVNCTACIDACDHMMEKVGFDKGLITYASENGIAKGEKLRFTRRMKMYTVLLTLLLGLLVTLLVTRTDFSATVMRAPGLLFQERGADSVSNLYNIKLVNKTMRAIPVSVKVEDGQGAIQIVGREIQVKPEDQGAGEFFIILPRNIIRDRKTRVKLGLYQGAERISTVTTSFLGPIAE